MTTGTQLCLEEPAQQVRPSGRIVQYLRQQAAQSLSLTHGCPPRKLQTPVPTTGPTS